jgi:hypothetical protein
MYVLYEVVMWLYLCIEIQDKILNVLYKDITITYISIFVDYYELFYVRIIHFDMIVVIICIKKMSCVIQLILDVNVILFNISWSLF